MRCHDVHRWRELALLPEKQPEVTTLASCQHAASQLEVPGNAPTADTALALQAKLRAWIASSS
jgi:hypothetical protein